MLVSRSCYYEMVPKKGLEPPHPCGYMDLNHARLPIPPLRLGHGGRASGFARQERTTHLFYRGSKGCQSGLLPPSDTELETFSVDVFSSLSPCLVYVRLD